MQKLKVMEIQLSNHALTAPKVMGEKEAAENTAVEKRFAMATNLHHE